MTPWNMLIPGDQVRGSDQRVWTVKTTYPGLRWVGAGMQDQIVILRGPGSREVTVVKPGHEPAPVVELTPREPEASAVTAVLQSFPETKYLGATLE